MNHQVPPTISRHPLLLAAITASFMLSGLIGFKLHFFRQYFSSWLATHRSGFVTPLPLLFSPTPTPTPSQAIELMTWLPWWDQTAVLDSLEQNATYFTTISPSFYHLTQALDIATLAPDSHQPIINIATLSGVLIMPTVGNDLDGPRGAQFLADEQKVDSAVDYLVDQALDHRYQGYDIDFESLPPESAENYNSFLAKLSAQFKHHGLLLSVAVHARTSHASDWELAQSHDYAVIGRYADQVRLMAYDYHYSGSPPGPITPLENLPPVLDYAKQTIPLHKIVLGIPLYGYDWPKGEQGIGLTHQEIQQLNLNSNSLWRDPNSTALTGTYSIDNLQHTLWFEDAHSTLAKINLAHDQGIYRFVFWRLGGEDPATWPLIASSSALIQPGE